MSQPTRTSLNSILLGDELGQIKLILLSEHHNTETADTRFDKRRLDRLDDLQTYHDDMLGIEERCNNNPNDYESKTLETNARSSKHRIVKITADCLQQEPAASRAIISIRPIKSLYESTLDTTDKPNHLFLITNKVGQVFVCNTDAIRSRLKLNPDVTVCHGEDGTGQGGEQPILSPIYYNISDKAPVCGSQPINQTNLLIIYQNGDIQHVNIGQEILQSSMRIKRKAIRTLGLGYNSDARAVHWRIDGSTGICYFSSDAAASVQLNENDPLTDIVLSSPTHKLSRKRTNRSQANLYRKAPCVQSRQCNEEDQLVPTQVINKISSRAEKYKPSFRTCKWSSITSLNLIYKKLALYDLVGSENFENLQMSEGYQVNCYKLNDYLLALGGANYAARVYDILAQKSIYNCRTGASKNPLYCPARGELNMIGDIDWLGGNKTTKKTPNMIATCSGIDSMVNVYDLRSPRPVFNIDLTNYTENKWQPYDNHPRGCMFTSICASGAPYSTAVPSQQLALGSTNGQLHIIDLRFVAKSHRLLGRMSGFCGGSIREMRFVSESFETSKMVSCASDRFVRVHRIQTSFTSVISQKLATKVFLGTKPTCIQPVCDEITQSYLASLTSRYGSESHLSTIGSGSWSLL